MNTVYTLISLFLLAALMGIFLLTLVLREKPTPKAIVLTHGAFAATGLVLLIFFVVKHGGDLVTSLILFALAATGGFILFSRDITGKKIPKWLAIAHGSIATIGFIILVVYAFTHFTTDRTY